jgi:hypothetical protein
MIVKSTDDDIQCQVPRKNGEYVKNLNYGVVVLIAW